MTVGELIELLSKANPDAYVQIRTANYLHTSIALDTMNSRDVILTVT